MRTSKWHRGWRGRSWGRSGVRKYRWRLERIQRPMLHGLFHTAWFLGKPLRLEKAAKAWGKCVYACKLIKLYLTFFPGALWVWIFAKLWDPWLKGAVKVQSIINILYLTRNRVCIHSGEFLDINQTAAEWHFLKASMIYFLLFNSILYWTHICHRTVVPLGLLSLKQTWGPDP